MVKTLAGIVPSIPLELGFCSLQISHTSCCPFFCQGTSNNYGRIRGKLPFLSQGPPNSGYGRIRRKLPFLSQGPPNNGYGRMPWKMPFWSQGPPNNGDGRTPFWSQGPPNNGYGRTPFSSQGPSNNRHGRTPFSSQGPSNNRHGRTPGKMPCVSPGPSSNYYGTLAFFPPFFAGSSACTALVSCGHFVFDVKCSTTTSTDPRNQICKLQRSILTFSTKY